MSHWLDEPLGRAASAWVDGARRHRVAVVVAAALATLACGLYAATHLSVNADTDAMLDDDVPFRQRQAELSAALPALDDNVVLVIDAASPARAARAAELVAQRLAREPGQYRHVFAPGVGPYFDRAGLLYLDLPELERLVDRLAAAQPFLTALSEDPTAPTLLGLLERVVGLEEGVALPTFDLPGALDAVSGVLAEPSGPPVAWEAWALGPDLARERLRRLVLVQPRVEYTALDAAERTVSALRSAATEALAPLGDPTLRLRITGDLALSAEELGRVAYQARWAAVVSFFAVLALMWVGLRSLRAMLGVGITLACALLWTAGFAALAIGHLNLISVAFGVLCIGLGVDFGIHFTMRYRELRTAGEPCAEALRETGSSVGGSLVLCALTTAIGFYAFGPTDYAGVAELGVIAGTGMFLCLLGTLTVLPALLGFAPGAGAAPQSALLVNLPTLPLRRPRLVLAVAAAVCVPAAGIAPRAHFDANPLNVRDPSAESVQAMQDLVRSADFAPWSADVLARSLEDAGSRAARLRGLPEVRRALTLASFVPTDQDEKLALIGDLGLLLGSVAPARPAGGSAPGELVDALARLEVAAAERLGRESDPPALTGSLRRLRAAARAARERLEEAEDPAAEARALEARLLGDLPDWLARLDVMLGAGPVELADLPGDLRERYLAADGRARIEVFPAGDPLAPHALARFVDAVRAVEPHAAGAAVSIVESARAIVTALVEALGGALVAIALLLLVLWRSPLDTVLVMTPLLLAALFTAAVTVLADLPFNFANVIVLPLLLGIGVDSGIHLVHRARLRADGDQDVLHTSTARAVLFSALTTIASFVSLSFSTHRGFASLGQLLALGVALTLLANLLVLPALLEWTELRRRRGRSR